MMQQQKEKIKIYSLNLQKKKKSIKQQCPLFPQPIYFSEDQIHQFT